MSESECYIKMEKNFIVQFPENGSYAQKKWTCD